MSIISLSLFLWLMLLILPSIVYLWRSFYMLPLHISSFSLCIYVRTYMFMYISIYLSVYHLSSGLHSISLHLFINLSSLSDISLHDLPFISLSIYYPMHISCLNISNYLSLFPLYFYLSSFHIYLSLFVLIHGIQSPTPIKIHKRYD